MLSARLRTRFLSFIRRCSYRPTPVVEIGKVALKAQGLEVGNSPDTAQSAEALRWPRNRPDWSRFSIPINGPLQFGTSSFNFMKNLSSSTSLGRAQLVIGWREPVAL